MLLHKEVIEVTSCDEFSLIRPFCSFLSVNTASSAPSAPAMTSTPASTATYATTVNIAKGPFVVFLVYGRRFADHKRYLIYIIAGLNYSRDGVDFL